MEYPASPPEAAPYVLKWYEAHGRKDLPWRTASGPYPVYVSEIMLQQTQVTSVESRFYHPFLAAFPTLSALAHAEEETLLKQWQGLGYYSRARNMHAAAKLTAPDLPDAPEALMRLPGIGRYTAHAVACFGFRRHTPIVDTNIRRLFSRVFALEKPAEAELWRLAEALLPSDPDRTFDYNQALLDIGSLVCRPKNPACLLCPLASICRGKTAPERYPAPAAKKKPPQREASVLFVRREQDGAVLMHKRASRFLHGYYTLPPTEADDACPPGRLLGVTRTIYSHFTGLVSVYAAPEDSPAALAAAAMPGNHWIAEKEAEALPLSSADTAMLRLAGVLTGKGAGQT